MHSTFLFTLANAISTILQQPAKTIGNCFPRSLFIQPSVEGILHTLWHARFHVLLSKDSIAIVCHGHSSDPTPLDKVIKSEFLLFNFLNSVLYAARQPGNQTARHLGQGQRATQSRGLRFGAAILKPTAISKLIPTLVC